MRRSLKVLHVIPSVAPSRGGPSVIIRTMTRGLSEAGLEVHIATTDDNGHGRLTVPHGVPLVQQGVTYWYFRRQTHFYQFSWPLSRWLSRHMESYDLAHIHALFSYASIPAAYAARRWTVPYIIRPLGTLNRWGMQNRRRRLKKLSFHLIERRILAGAAGIHYTSEQERLEASELGINGRSTIVPLGVELGPIEALPSRGWLRARAPHLAQHILMLFLSRLDRKKGLDLLLRSFALVRTRRSDVTLVVAGSGEPGFEASLRQEAAALGIADNVFWAGFLAGQEKVAALADADLFVLPSYSENFGVSVVEAMASGLPVVVSDRVGIHREVASTGAGIVVPCDVEALADATLTLIADSGLRHQLGQRGRCLAYERFSVQAMTAALIEMYRDALGCVRASAPSNPVLPT